MTRDELQAWIEELRGCLERGELRRRKDLEGYVWYLLLNVDALRRTTPGERAQPNVQRAIRQVRAELLALHAHLQQGGPEPLMLGEWRR